MFLDEFNYFEASQNRHLRCRFCCFIIEQKPWKGMYFVYPCPEKFFKHMQVILDDEKELELFMRSVNEDQPCQGLRFNPLKINQEEFLSLAPFALEPIPWCQTGFYYAKEDRPGKHPYHAAGLYYIQEPSAMAVVEALAPKPGEFVLDLCAAPGGKSTQIAGYLGERGLLVANEINGKRAKALSENLERWGTRNTVVTNESPERLAKSFLGFFDKILVDAPCSGEGMFRKLPEAAADWSPEKVLYCSAMQKDILDLASDMLKPGGVLVYSTCTFSKTENELQVRAFLQRSGEFQLETASEATMIPAGDLKGTYRIWPHKHRGEGHFIACLRKKGTSDSLSLPLEAQSVSKASSQAAAKETSQTAFKSVSNHKRIASKVAKGDGQTQSKLIEAERLFALFAQECLTVVPQGRLELFGDQLYLLPTGIASLDGIRAVRAGWHLGTIKRDRFEPSHALALGLRPGQWRFALNLLANSLDVMRFLKGESLETPVELKGWIMVTVDGFPLGWGKASQGQLKNHYPKGLRWL